MRKMLAYKFRLYPNQEEERKLLWTKEVCRLTYNKFLELYYGGEHDRGTQKVRSERPELTLVDTGPLLVSAKIQQVGWMKQEASPARAG